jgi:hypothetical protein
LHCPFNGHHAGLDKALGHGAGQSLHGADNHVQSGRFVAGRENVLDLYHEFPFSHIRNNKGAIINRALPK